MIILLYSLIFLISCVVVIKSASLTIKALVKIAKFLKWSEFFVSFLLMAIATSLPELFVGITSAIHGIPQLSFGNIIGSNIINLTLVISIAVLLGGKLVADNLTTQRTTIYTALAALLPLLLMLDGKISRIDGVLLLVVLGFYLRWIFKMKNKFKEKFNNFIDKTEESTIFFLKDLTMFFVGVLLLILSSEGIVWTSSKMAISLGIPAVVIGTVLVALGTNLPEIIFSIKAIKMGHKGMVLGNLMGSVIFNSTLVLGITVLISPLKIFAFSPYVVGIAFTIFVVLFFRLFIKSKQSISKKEALLLLAIYLTFIATQFVLS